MHARGLPCCRSRSRDRLPSGSGHRATAPGAMARERQSPQAHRDALPPREEPLEDDEAAIGQQRAIDNVEFADALDREFAGRLAADQEAPDVACRRRARARRSRSACRQADFASARPPGIRCRGSPATWQSAGGRGSDLRARQQSVFAHSRISRSGARARCRHRACRRRRRALRCRTIRAPSACGRPARASARSRHRRCRPAQRRDRRCGRAANAPCRSPRRNSRRPAAILIPDSPPNSLCGDDNSMPPRNSSAPKRLRAGSRDSKRLDRLRLDLDADGRLGAALRRMPARRASTMQAAASPLVRMRSMQSPPRGAARFRLAACLGEQFGELFGHRAAELLGIDDGDRAPVIARDVVADADRDQLDRRARLDFLDDVAQMPLEIIAGIDRQAWNRRPARRPRSSSGCAAARCGRADADRPS